MARLVVDDFDFNGCPMRKDDWVLLPFPAANRDPEAFDRADEVIIDRTENRHAAFGLGIHRCLGSNLARMELRIASRPGSSATPTSSSPTRTRCAGRVARCAVHASFRSASLPAEPRHRWTTTHDEHAHTRDARNER